MIEPDIWKTLPIFALLLLFASPMTAEDKALPEALESLISERISGTSSEEKQMIGGWSAAKKLSEFFCQDAALSALEKVYAGADRVILSMSDDAPPEFVGDDRVGGSGTVRHDEGWANFTYECEVDPRTGNASEFVFEALAG